MKFPILYQDDCLVAIDKPAGMAVHRDLFSPRGQVVCLQLLRDQLGREVHPIHRLDSATSGVLLFSHDREMLALMMKEFMERRVEKIYQAIVRGWMKAAVTCQIPIKKEETCQEAVTHFRPLEYLEMPWPNERFPHSRYSFIEASPKTGRFHQIRRHANYLAHPIVGDTKHGDSQHNRLWRSERDCHRLLLHAHQIKFCHPMTKLQITIEAPLSEDFSRHLEELPWKARY